MLSFFCFLVRPLGLATATKGEPALDLMLSCLVVFPSRMSILFYVLSICLRNKICILQTSRCVDNWLCMIMRIRKLGGSSQIASSHGDLRASLFLNGEYLWI